MIDRMQRWLPLPVQLFLLCLVGWVNRRQGQAIEYLLAENRLYKQALGGKPLRLTDAQRRLLARKGRPLGKQLLAEVATVVTPETILRWYRELVARKYDGRRRGQPGPGRPRTRAQLAELIVRVALENPLFGYTRIVQTLEHLQLRVSRSTVAAILKERGSAGSSPRPSAAARAPGRSSWPPTGKGWPPPTSSRSRC